tara:strand:- start:169236 stop:170099 length:864 start_codon:yes stop_codon:yes gene_type:complete
MAHPKMIKLPRIGTVFGVDFSGAAQSGKTAWLAELRADGKKELELIRFGPIGRFAGADDREIVCKYLVNEIQASTNSLWGCDFPFGLPIELGLGTWPKQLRHVRQFSGTAQQYGRELVAITRQKTGQMHVRRDTDRETKTPFDCYHYRIIHQTVHGMNQVLLPLSGDKSTAVLPFHYRRSGTPRRVVVEACPSSTLKRLELPHMRYKQSGGKPPNETHLKTRKKIMRGIRDIVSVSAYQRRVIMSDSGGDALDAVLAGIGAWNAFRKDDHEAIAKHKRYPIEGRVYC